MLCVVAVGCLQQGKAVGAMLLSTNLEMSTNRSFEYQDIGQFQG